MLMLWVGYCSSPILLAFTPQMLAEEAYATVAYGWLSVAFCLTVGYARAIDYRVKAWGLIGSVLFTSMLILTSAESDRGAGTANLIMGVGLAALVLGRRGVIITGAAAAALLLGCALGYSRGWLPYAPISPFIEASFASWMGTALNVLAALAVLVASSTYLLQRLQDALATKNRVVENLREESARRMAALEELQRAQNRLIEAQRLETVGMLAGGLAHDMNNALTVILAETQMMDREPEAAENIQTAANHVAQLTRQLLSFGRKAVVQPRRIDLVETVHGALHTLRRALPKDVHVDEVLGDAPVHVIADPTEIQQLVFNLAMNARDAMPRGGTLTVTLETLRAVEGAGRVRLVVRDTGTGMDAETKARIFEPFFTTKSHGRGTGLGLATVRGIIDRRGGEIAVDSAPGRGTAFTMVFPEATATSDAPTPTPPNAGPALVHHRRALVVDDDDAVRAVVVRGLRAAGFVVSDVNRAQAALDLARQAREAFDLVWTDVVMPDGAPVDLVQWIEAHAPRTGIIVCSGFTTDQVMQRGIDTGHYVFVPKPFTIDDVGDATTRALRLRDERNRVAPAHSA
jgi:signal transduction histidine kinase/ActR/RegA family two-component response regulator